MFFIENKSVKYHVFVSIFRAALAGILVCFGAEMVAELDKWIIILPYTVSALCFLRLAYEDYREIKRRFPQALMGSSYFAMAVMSMLAAINGYSAFATEDMWNMSLSLGVTISPCLAAIMNALVIFQRVNAAQQQQLQNDKIAGSVKSKYTYPYMAL